MKFKFLTMASAILLSSTSLFAAFGSMSVSSSTHDTTNKSKATDVVLSWAAPTVDGTTVLNGYYYKLDTTSTTLMTSNNTNLADTATSKTQTITGSDGSYYFHIAPYATNGDIGATAHFGPIKIDTTAPSVSVTPDGGSFTSIQTVTMTGADASNYTIYYTTDGSTPSSTNGNTYAEAITISSSKTLKAIAIDSAGNSSAVKSSTFTINTTTNIAQFGNEIGAGETVATNSDGNSGSAKRTISVEGSAVTHYKYKVDTGSFGAQTIKATNIDVSALSDGQHTISIVGYDGTTWQSDSSATTLTFTVDNTAPSVISFSTASGSTITTNTTITMTSANSNNIRYTLDGSDPTVSTGTLSSTLALTSSHSSVTLRAIAYDNAGNKTSITQALYTVNIATTSSSGGGGTTTVPDDTTTVTDDNTTTVTDDNTTTVTDDNTTTVPDDTTTVADDTNTTTTINDDGSTTKTTSFIDASGETVEVEVVTNIDTASTVTNEDGTITTTATATKDSGEVVETEVIINTDGTAENSFSIGGETSDISVAVAGADTTINSDGSIQTLAEVTGTDGVKTTATAEVKTDGTTTNTVEVTDAGGEIVSSDINVSIVGADTTIKVDGAVETTANTTTDDGVRTVATVEVKADGTTDSNVTVTNSTNETVETSLDTNIGGTDSSIASDGAVTMITPVVVTALGANVATTVVVDSLGKVKPSFTVGTNVVTMPEFEAGSEADIKHENGKVLVEIRTTLTQAITFN